MDFDYSDDRRMLADSLDRYIAEQYTFPVRDAIAKSAEGFSAKQWAQFAELGAIGALLPESDGGFGGTGFDVALVFESLGRGLVVEPFLGALIVGRALVQAGNAEQKALVAEVCAGTQVVAFAHDEPNSHYEPTLVATRAERDGEGWRLNGAKAVVRQAEAADVLLVSARVSGAVSDADGIALFLVPRSAAGVSLRGYATMDGGRAAEVTLADVALGSDALVGIAGKGAEILAQATGWGVLALCAEALGAMEVARRDTLEYLRTRKQFGVPIGTFQALQHRMADLLLEIEQARSAVIGAAAAIEATGTRRERALAGAKYTIGRIGAKVAEECIQLHGGIGVTWELPLAHYAKRLVLIDHELGDEDFHLARYIALNAKEAA